MVGRPGRFYSKDKKLVKRVVLWASRGLSVRAIADKVGISYPTVWRILNKLVYEKARKKR